MIATRSSLSSAVPDGLDWVPALGWAEGARTASAASMSESSVSGRRSFAEQRLHRLRKACAALCDACTVQ